MDPQRVAREIWSLPESSLLASAGSLRVHILRKTDPRLLRKYTSESAWARFQQKHRARAPRNGDGGQAA